MFTFHKNWKKPKVTTEISLVRIIMALGLAGIDTIWALYLNSFGLSESAIGFISAGLVIITLMVSFYSTIILEKIGEYKLIITSLIIYILAYLSFAFFKNLYFFLGTCILITMTSIFRREAFGILFRDEADNDKLSEEIGLLYSLLNFSWMVGPLIAGFILAQYGMSQVFIFSAISFIISLLIFISLDIKPIKKERIKIDSNIIENLQDYIKKIKLNIAYVFGAGVEIWWALIYIYIPLFIIKNGLGEEIVGIFLAAVVVPLAVFEYKVGKLSEKYGFKIFLFWGFFLVGIAGIFAFFSPNIYFTLAILALASIPMAAVEPLQESFFFKQIKSNEEEKYYPIFTTSADIGSFIGKFSIAGVLLFLPEKYAYLTIAIFMILCAIICLKIKDLKNSQI